MSDDATLRALEARATPGRWTPDGDKIRATAADAGVSVSRVCTAPCTSTPA